LTKVSSDDFQWFTQHFGVSVSTKQRQRYRSWATFSPNDPYTNDPVMIEYENVFDVNMSESDLAYIISVLRQEHKETEMRKRWSNVAEAYMNYRTTLYLTCDPFIE
jgi:hypothetical protein